MRESKIEGHRIIDEDELRACGGFVEERFADDFAAEVAGQGVAVEDLLDLVGLHGAGEAEFERPAPGIGDEVAADEPAWLVKDRQEAEAVRDCRRDVRHHASFPWSIDCCIIGRWGEAGTPHQQFVRQDGHSKLDFNRRHQPAASARAATVSITPTRIAGAALQARPASARPKGSTQAHVFRRGPVNESVNGPNSECFGQLAQAADSQHVMDRPSRRTKRRLGHLGAKCFYGWGGGGLRVEAFR